MFPPTMFSRGRCMNPQLAEGEEVPGLCALFLEACGRREECDILTESYLYCIHRLQYRTFRQIAPSALHASISLAAQGPPYD